MVSRKEKGKRLKKRDENIPSEQKYEQQKGW